MRVTRLLACLVACSLRLAWADSVPGPNEVLVAQIAEPLPHDKSKREQFLWDTFANKPQEQKFIYYHPVDWKQDFATFAQTLVRKATEKSLDAASLSRALAAILKDADPEVAYLPIAAYQTTLDGKPIWIVTANWEYASWVAKARPGRIAMGHIRMFAFDQKTTELLAFMTCG